jgi:hypothetical protein
MPVEQATRRTDHVHSLAVRMSHRGRLQKSGRQTGTEHALQLEHLPSAFPPPAYISRYAINLASAHLSPRLDPPLSILRN